MVWRSNVVSHGLGNFATNAASWLRSRASGSRRSVVGRSMGQVASSRPAGGSPLGTKINLQRMYLYVCMYLLEPCDGLIVSCTRHGPRNHNAPNAMHPFALLEAGQKGSRCVLIELPRCNAANVSCFARVCVGVRFYFDCLLLPQPLTQIEPIERKE